MFYLKICYFLLLAVVILQQVFKVLIMLYNAYNLK